MTAAEPPRAVVVIRQPHGDVVVGDVGRHVRCDLGLVDDLLHLRLLARRLGWDLAITDVRDDLRELFDLVGLTDEVAGRRDQPSRWGGSPNSANSSG